MVSPLSAQPMSPVYVVETIPALPEKQEELKVELSKLLPVCRKEKGCISYELFQDIANVSIFRIAMRWERQVDYTVHNAAPHMSEFAQNFLNVLYEKKQIIKEVYQLPIPGQPRLGSKPTEEQVEEHKEVVEKVMESGSQVFSPEILCISYFEVKPQYREDLIRELLKLVELTQKEEGCIYYELYFDEKNPDLIILPSKFISAQSLDVHERKPYIVSFLEGPMNNYCERVTWNEALEIKNP